MPRAYCADREFISCSYYHCFWVNRDGTLVTNLQSPRICKRTDYLTPTMIKFVTASAAGQLYSCTKSMNDRKSCYNRRLRRIIHVHQWGNTHIAWLACRGFVDTSYRTRRLLRWDNEKENRQAAHTIICACLLGTRPQKYVLATLRGRYLFLSGRAIHKHVESRSRYFNWLMCRLVWQFICIHVAALNSWLGMTKMKWIRKGKT